VQKDLLTKYGMLPPARPASKPTGAQGVSSNNSTPNRPATNQGNNNSDTNSVSNQRTPSLTERSTNSTTGSQPATPQWQGKLCWQGVDPITSTRKEMSTIVEAKLVMNDCHWRLWPSVLNLSPAKTPQPGFAALQQVIKRINAGVASLMASSSATIQKQESEANYEMLCALLTSKTVVATANLGTDTEGGPALTLVIFPTMQNSTNSNVLLAAVMPQQTLTALAQITARNSVTGNQNIPRTLQQQQQMAMAHALMQQRQAQAQGQGQGNRPLTMPPSFTPEMAAALVRQNQSSQMNLKPPNQP